VKKLSGLTGLVIGALSLGIILLTLVLFYEPIKEGRCKLYRRKTDPRSQLIGLASQFITPLTDKPDRAQDVPTGFEQPRYYEIKSGNKPVLMAADFSQKQVRLCVDTDNDGILSEERCFTAKLRKETPVSGKRQQVGPISLVSGHSTSRTDDAFYINCFREDARGLLIPFPAFYRTGKLRLAGRTYRIALVDGDRDGLYSSILSLPLERPWRFPACDVFAIDLNQNGTFEISLYERSEVVPLGKLVKVENEYYAINIAPDGSSLELSRTEPQLGILVIESNGADVELRLWSDAADQHLSQGRQWQLPAGEYKAIHAILTKMDASGDLCMLSSNSSSALIRLGPLEHFAIKPREVTSIKIGPPFIVKADVQQAESGTLLIAPVLVGCSGEEYLPGLKQGRKRPSPPAFKIVDEKGTTLAADNFQYG
jgi:hypothetical protein